MFLLHYKNQRTSDYFPSNFRLCVYARGEAGFGAGFFLEGVSIGGHNFFGNLICKFLFLCSQVLYHACVTFRSCSFVAFRNISRPLPGNNISQHQIPAAVTNKAT